MQLDARCLARAEVNQETGRKVGSSAAEILANIDAMELSTERAANLEWLQPIDFLDVHRVLLDRVAATQRTRPAVANAIEELEAAGILVRLTESARNRAWEADGFLDLIVGLESGAS